MKYEMKPLFEERMKKLIPEKEDFFNFLEIIRKSPRNFIRCNTLKISPEELLKRLEKKWLIEQPFKEHPEIMLIKQELNPGELGNSIEHLLGYYYIQELSSMLSVIALDPKKEEFVLDMCASPGSKTTQIAAKMENTGTIIANDIKIDRIKILSANLERCGVANTIVTRMDAIELCGNLAERNIKFDKILLDAPCSGEGTLRSSPRTFLMWNIKAIRNLSRQQKKLIAYALKCLKKNGVLVYSTCTHAPEENEEVIDFALKNFPIKLEKVELPIKCRAGITNWEDKEYDKSVQHACRIYPQDNDSEGFFVAKFTIIKEISE